jgi:hypothetical protein
MVPRAGLDRCKNLAPSGIRSPDFLAHNESLYWLRYPSPRLKHCDKNNAYKIVQKYVIHWMWCFSKCSWQWVICSLCLQLVALCPLPEICLIHDLSSKSLCLHVRFCVAPLTWLITNFRNCKRWDWSNDSVCAHILRETWRNYHVQHLIWSRWNYKLPVVWTSILGVLYLQTVFCFISGCVQGLCRY